MSNTLVLCGGTGAHVGVAFLRLHTLGCLLGFFENAEGRLLLPDLFLIDQDSGDGGHGEHTAWQEAKALVAQHPGRADWQATGRRAGAPPLTPMTPLPVGEDQGWYRPPHERLRERFGTSPLLPVFASALQGEITYSQGMMGSPAVGAVLFDLKRLDSRDGRINHDKSYGQLLARRGRIVVAASGVGGTGASVGPVVAERLAKDGQGQSQVMAVMVLPWFHFDPTRVDDRAKEKAARRNRVMLENGSTALASYGERLCDHVATLPIGVPERSRKTRVYTSDQSQAICESYVHAVAALAAYQHFLRAREGFPHGLYVQGAVEPGRLPPSTPIPGGTLQSLANRAVSLHHLLGTLDRVLTSTPVTTPLPALWQALDGLDRASTAQALREMASHYREQIDWLEQVLEVPKPNAATELSLESLTRRRLRERPLELRPDTPPAAAATHFFRWAAELVRDHASSANELVLPEGRAEGGHWPERTFDSGQVAPTSAAEPTPLQSNQIQMVLASFIDPERVTSGSWPHPLAAAECFEYLLVRGQQRARRQLELMLAGLAAGLLEARPLAASAARERVSLEALTEEHRRGEHPGVAELGLYLRHQGREHLLGFNAPATLLCPAPTTGEPEEEARWQYLWQELTSDTSGETWWKAVSPSPWRMEGAVRKVQWWLSRVSARFQATAGAQPSWLSLFQQGEAREAPTSCGLGRSVRAFWGNAAQGGNRLIAVELPSAREIPPELTEDVEQVTPGELEGRIPGFSQLGSDPTQLAWALVDFEKPGGRGRGIWLDHLEKLRELRRLWAFAEVGGNLVLRFLENDELQTVVVPGTEILSRDSITVIDVFCVEPDPLRPGGPSLPRYPHAPLRSDYYGLLKGDHERSLFELVRTGKEVPTPPAAPREHVEPTGELVLTWELALLGRSKPLPVERKFRPQELGQQAHARTKAHWMVWPRFRSQRQPGWRAYYVYDWCDQAQRIALDVLWLDPSEGTSGGLRRREPAIGSRVVGGYPVAYAGGEGKGHHTGGPPLALVPRKRLPGSTDRDAEELGLFLVDLELLSDASEEARLAVDFGSSHSVAAFQLQGRDAEIVRFAPELDPNHVGNALTRSIAECAGHVEAPASGVGVIKSGQWMPTYRAHRRGISLGLLPSEILLRNDGQRKDPLGPDFLPQRDFGIPPFDIARANLGELVVSDLKWNPADMAEPQRAKAYREHYLVALLELAAAELSAVHVKGLPKQPLDVIFTYPLRSSREQIRDFQIALGRVLDRVALSTGLTLRLKGDIGIFDESRAARIEPTVPGQVSVVADLGGGTLDLFISATAAGDVTFRDLADSIRVGGGVLIRALARRAPELLPSDAGWVEVGKEAADVEAKLRTWIRLEGSSSLFGTEDAQRPRFDELGVAGYANAASGNQARELIDRYFSVVIEYVARSVAGYLVREWYSRAPSALRSMLKVYLSLRGNGWRLRYQQGLEVDYSEIAEAVIKAMKGRVCELWESLPDNQYPKPEDDRHWATATHQRLEDAKTFPVKQVVSNGEAWSYDKARARWHSYTPVELEVVGADGVPAPMPWSSPLPLELDSAKDVTVRQLVPPVPLESSSPGDLRSLSELEAPLLADLNRQLQLAGGRGTSGDGTGRETYLAPVGAIVWESLTRSRSFQHGE